MRNVNALHTNLSPFVGSKTNTTLWKYQTDGGVFSSPAIGSDGTIYIGSTDNYLYAIYPSGTLKWTYLTGGTVFSSPAIGSDGTIYVGSFDSYFYAFNPSGTLKWGYLTGATIHSSPAIGSDGTIYVASYDKYLYAFSSSGTLKWRYQTGLWGTSPAIGSDGTIYVGSTDRFIYAIKASGTLKWRYQTGGSVYSSPAIGSDGTIYVGSNDHYLHAINPSGTLKWSYQTGWNVYSSPAIGSDGTIYVGSYDTYLYAINSSGTLKWRYQTNYSEAFPAIGSDGTIYMGSKDHSLYAITSFGTLKWRYQTGGSLYSSPAIGSDGTIYLGSDDHHLHAIRDPNSFNQCPCGIQSSYTSTQTDVCVGCPPPVLTLVSNVESRMNSNQKLSLFGYVGLPPGTESGMVQWSVDSPLLSLSSVSLLPVSIVLTSSGVVNQVLVRDSLLPGRYVFTLTCLVTAAPRVSVSVSVTVNAGPVNGLFSMSPSQGHELTDQFRFQAMGWEDPDLPLTYQFGFFSPSSRFLKILQFRSADLFLLSPLPAGSSTSNSSLKCSCEVFDSFGAESSLIYSVIVIRSTSTYMQSLNSINEQLDSQLPFSSLSSQKQTFFLNVEILNSVSCVSAPNCSALNRQECSLTSNTCGPCFQGSYVGDSGDGNGRCLRIDLAQPLSLSCSESQACFPGFDCVGGQCLLPQKQCLSNCSDHGNCALIRTGSGDGSGTVLSSCRLGGSSCETVCQCRTGYSGSSCSYDSETLSLKRLIREKLGDQLKALVSIEEPNIEIVKGWVSGSFSLTQQVDELSSSLALSSLSFFQSILLTAKTLSNPLSVEDLLPLLDSIDILGSTLIKSSVHRRRTQSQYHSNSTSLTPHELFSSVLGQFTEVLSLDLVEGQVPFEVAKTNFKLSSQVVSTSSNQTSLSCAQTSLEAFLGTSPQSARLTLTPNSSTHLAPTSLSLVSISSSLYGDPSFLSDPITLISSSQFFGSVRVTLQMNEHQPYHNQSTLNSTSVRSFVTECVLGSPSLWDYNCEDALDSVLHVECNGTAGGLVRSFCPSISSVPSCRLLDDHSLLSPDSQSCKVEIYSDNTLTCLCSIPPTRMKKSLVFVSVASYLSTNFAETWESASHLTLIDVRSSLNCLLMLVGIGCVMISLAIWGYFADRMNQHMHSQVTSDKHFPQHHLKYKFKCQGQDTFDLMEEVLPYVLQPRPFLTKVVGEMKHYHRWASVLYLHSNHLPRPFRVLTLATNLVIMFFLQAVVFKANNPDDGTCEAVGEESLCRVQQPVFYTGHPKCTWDSTNGRCSFLSLNSDVKITIYVSIFAAVFTVPFVIISEWIVHSVLSAPLDQSNHLKIGFNNLSQLFQKVILFLISIFNPDSIPSVFATCEQEYSDLHSNLIQYRFELSKSVQVEFDKIWGLDENGQFKMNIQHSYWTQFICSSKESEAKLELVRIRDEVDRESSELIEKSSEEIRKRLIYLFQRDLLPGIGGKVLDYTSEKGQSEPTSVSLQMKVLGWLAIVGMNLGMLFYVYLFAVQQSQAIRDVWMRSMGLWIMNEIIIVSTLLVFVTHIMIPSLIMFQSMKVKDKLVRAIQAFQSRPDEDFGLPKKNHNSFNAAKYFFVSHRLALKYPHLRESQIILSYSTPYPQWSPLSLIVSSVPMPEFLQDLLIEEIGALLAGFLDGWFFDLYQISPFLLPVIFLVVIYLLHFYLKSMKEQQNPSQQQSHSISPDLEIKPEQLQHSVPLSSRVHPTRRQSIAKGIELNQQLCRLTREVPLPQPLEESNSFDHVSNTPNNSFEQTDGNRMIEMLNMNVDQIIALGEGEYSNSSNSFEFSDLSN